MPPIHELAVMRNRRWVFKDRRDAGRVLGRMLAPGYGRLENAIVLGIPMGGVPVAAAIAERLKCPLDLVIVRKIQVPGNTETGFGAMTADGETFLNEALLAGLQLTPEQVLRQSAEVRRQLDERNRALRRGREFPDLAGRTVILADDGLATGFTMKASIHMACKHGAAAVVVAVPTAPLRSLDALGDAAAEIYCANIRETVSFAVAEAYERWHDLTAPEVLELLAREPQSPSPAGPAGERAADEVPDPEGN